MAAAWSSYRKWQHTTDDSQTTEPNRAFRIIDLLSHADREAADRLVYLGPRIINQLYGEAVLYWVWYNSSLSSDRSHIMDSVIQTFEEYFTNHVQFVGSEHRYRMLRKAKYSMWRSHTRELAVDGLRLYDSIAHIQEYLLSLPMPENFPASEGFALEAAYAANYYEKGYVTGWTWQDFDQQGNDMSVRIGEIENAEEGELRTIGKDQDWSGTAYRVYLDAPAGIMLTHHGKPVAIVGFTTPDQDTLFINQFQQVAHSNFSEHGVMTSQTANHIAKVRDWQTALYRITEQLARDHQYENISIQSGNNNEWCRKYKETIDAENGRMVMRKTPVPHLRMEVANKIYDVFANGMGFAKDPSPEGNWIKTLR